MAKTEIRESSCDLSQLHAGQTIEHTARIQAEGRYYRDRMGEWTADRWRAVHEVHDRSDGTREVTVSPWMSSFADAERWLETERDLVIGGAGTPLRAVQS